MSIAKSGVSILLVLASIVASVPCLAADGRIEIVRAEGTVATSDAAGKKQKAVGAKAILPSGNTLTTGPNGRAVVRVGNSGYVVLEKNSKLAIDNSQEKAGFLRQLTGLIYYAMNTLKGDQKLEVRTEAATIGVRGTRFLVAVLPDRNEVDMRKGKVSISSTDGEFEIHKKAEQDEFEAYQQEARDAIAKEQRKFDEYKARTAQEFIEYKREFSLEANRMASFDGRQVVDRPLSAESVKDLESFESYADEWLKQVED